MNLGPDDDECTIPAPNTANTNTKEWARLPLPELPTPSAVRIVLSRWWTDTPQKGRAHDVRRVAFVDSRIPSAALAEDQTTVIPVTLREVIREQSLDLDEYELCVFYALVRADQTIRVLGGVPPSSVRRWLGPTATDPLMIGDLSRLFWYHTDGSKPTVQRGSNSRTFWMYLELLSPAWREWQTAAGTNPHSALTGTCMDRIAMRSKLMMVFWKNRGDKAFAGPGGPGTRALANEHRPGTGYFDLFTEEGRQRERAEYWALAFACAHEPALWEARAYWERALFAFRCERFFCKERHFSLLLEMNQLLRVGRHPNPKGKEELDEDSPRIGRHVVRDVVLGEKAHTRDRENFARRWPDDPIPDLWAGVPVATAGPAIVGSPLHDVDRGHVYITHKEFPEWASYQMDAASASYTKTAYFRFRQSGYSPHDEEGARLMSLLWQVIGPTMMVIRRDAAEKREQRARERDGMAVEQIGDMEDLAATARSTMPLCMARHVWAALEQGTHPKNNSRVSLAKFLLEAGYETDQVDGAMKILYASDREYVRTAHRGKWDDEVYARDFGKQVANLYKSVIAEKRIGAYGCKSLVAAGSSGAAHGCPFAEADGASDTTRELLRWTGLPAPDIEDIMRPSMFPQEKCSRDFRHRRHVDVSIVVNHPNQYMRGRSAKRPREETVGEMSGDGRVKRE